MILTAGWILPVTSPPIRDGAVAIRKNRIAWVGPADSLPAAFGDDERRSFGDAFLLPGLVNVHSHLEYTVLGGMIGDLPFVPWLLRLVALGRRLTPENLEVSALWGAARSIRSGVTCLGDVSSRGGAVTALRQAGLRAVVFMEALGLEEREAPRIAARALERAREVKALGDPRLRGGISPHAPYTVSPRLYRECCRLAGEEGFPLLVHLAESAAEEELLLRGEGELAEPFRQAVGWGRIGWEAPGCRPVEYLERLGVLGPGVLAAHCVRVTPGEARILARKGVAVAHCPTSNALLRAGRAPVPVFLREGITVGLGTDSAASNPAFDLWGEMRLAFLLARAGGKEPEVEPLAARQAVEMATLGGARALGLEGEIGSLEQGKKADIVVLRMPGGVDPGWVEGEDPCLGEEPCLKLVHLACGRDVIFTMVEGETLYEGGRFRTLDVKALREATGEIRARLNACNAPGPVLELAEK